MVNTKKIILSKPFDGLPTLSNFEIIEEEIGEPADGEILCEALYWSVDPYMRLYPAKPGQLMIGGQIAKILKSRNAKYSVGSHVYGHFGWRTHTIVNPDIVDPTNLAEPYLLPSFGNLSTSLGLGVFGRPGNSAYFGFLEICNPKAGDTVVVTGAAGAVGSLVGQIAKIKRCTVIGFAGTDEKCDYLTNELGFDYAFNYKTTNITEALSKAAPKGVDCFFDNVGGEISSTVFMHMNLFGRISVCGSISAYNEKERPKARMIQRDFTTNQLRMEGFRVNRWSKRFLEGIAQMLSWVQSGQIKYNETITEGFENMPKAFIGMLTGGNIGKAIVKA